MDHERVPAENVAPCSSSAVVLIEDSSLAGWELIGGGGFGKIYRARHERWCHDVAIKLLHYDDGSSSCLMREMDMMRQGSSEHVMPVLGIFRGWPPNSGPSAQLGLVMKYMEKGSLASLQGALQGAPPLPLIFRLAHQVALGINYLHTLSPAVLHLDLKPSNVLLDSYLNVKLTDFGLAKIYHSVTRPSRKISKEDEAGTISYMPPEAFEVTYNPTRASDIYSYGILLWSIVTGKPPYQYAMSSMVRLRIPQGDRPSLESFSSRAELRELVELMMRCWEATPTQRPSAFECTTITEKLYNKHKHGILDVVHQVLKKLELSVDDRVSERLQRLHISQLTEAPKPLNMEDDVLTGRAPVQEMGTRLTSNPRELAAAAQDQHLAANTGRRGDQASNNIKPSSVHPISAAMPPPQPPSARRSPQDGTHKKPHPQSSAQHDAQQYKRQISNPIQCPRNPPQAGSVQITASHVTGLQYGSNNIMYIGDFKSDPNRRRHQTAPSGANPPPRTPARNCQKK